MYQINAKAAEERYSDYVIALTPLISLLKNSPDFEDESGISDIEVLRPEPLQIYIVESQDADGEDFYEVYKYTDFNCNSREFLDESLGQATALEVGIPSDHDFCDRLINHFGLPTETQLVEKDCADLAKEDVYEWYAISYPLVRLLQDEGEKVVEFCGLNVWCRGATGQRIWYDEAFLSIGKKLLAIKAQAQS